MDTFVCRKCGSTDVEIKVDARGVARMYCSKCGAFIQAVNIKDILPLIDDLKERVHTLENPEGKEDNRLPCQYCTEKYILLRGNERTRIFPVPIDIKYCPICGRKLSEKDKEY